MVAPYCRVVLMIKATEEMGKLIADDDANRSDQVMAIGRARAATVAVKHVARNSYAGTATLNGTTAVSVAATGIDANSLVLLTVQPGAVPLGSPYVASITAGTGFTLKSTNAGDTAVVVAWYIVEAV